MLGLRGDLERVARSALRGLLSGDLLGDEGVAARGHAPARGVVHDPRLRRVRGLRGLVLNIRELGPVDGVEPALTVLVLELRERVHLRRARGGIGREVVALALLRRGDVGVPVEALVSLARLFEVAHRLVAVAAPEHGTRESADCSK